MEFLIIRGLSSILEAVLWTYFIVSVAKITNKGNVHFEKSKIITFFISLVILILLRIFN